MAKRRWTRGGVVLAVVGAVAVILLIFGFAMQQTNQPHDVDLSTMLADIKIDVAHQQVDTLSVNSNQLVLIRADGVQERTGIGEGFQLGDALKRDGGIDYTNPKVLKVDYTDPGLASGIGSVLMTLVPIALIGLLLYYFVRQMQGGNSQAISFGKSRARMFNTTMPVVTFNEVAGVEEAKQELEEIVEFLKYPTKFVQLGARIPKGVLLIGPPGTGKTLVSRAVAGEAGVPFFSISGSEFVEMFVGVGASRVRDLFDQAKKAAPCIIFVDEIDAVGRQRGMGVGGSHDEREQTLNQMLVEMDGFDATTNVIVMAATNRPDVLDPALLRPGRFDRQVRLDNPDVRGRQQILEVHARGKPLDTDISIDKLARQTAGFSGADLANLLNEAAILAARENKTQITMNEVEEAVDRVVAGPARKSRIISEREKAVTAYHEIGHALVARVLPHCDPVHKVSIVARGQMGGYTRLVAEEDRSLWSKSHFEDFLAFALGGHLAEKIIFGEVTTGASNDIERVSTIARNMVTQYGMSERLGTIQYGQKDDAPFMARDSHARTFSEETAREIDEEVRRIVQHAYVTAERVLTEHKERLILMSEQLIQAEILEGQEFEELFRKPLAGPVVVTEAEADGGETLAALSSEL